MAEHLPSDADAAATTSQPDPQLHRYEPGRAERIALRILQAGAVAVVLAAVTWRDFELDRFFVPKELVLHATAFFGGLFAIRAIGRLRFTRVDILLLGFLAWSVVSALFATNGWVAVRALSLSVSGVVIFWAARALCLAGFSRPLLGAVAVAVVLGAVTGLLQTYGVRTDLFSINRAPGGTFGNRNFVAHMAAFGMPVLLFAALRASSVARWLIGAVGVLLVAGMLVLTRSRAGFLAFGAVLGVMGVAMLIAPALRTHGRTWRRLAGTAVLAGAGIAGVVFAPNSLNWRSDNPYLESITGVANYQEGSGRGRLVQYRRSFAMALDNPVLGVGPGNWAVEYDDYAERGDPSMDRSDPGTTSNPWPSSDWMAYLSERGFIGALLLGLAVVGIALAALRDLLRADSAEDALAASALIATLAAAVVAGMFDAVLLIAPPALLVWATAGALHQPRGDLPGGTRSALWSAAVAGMIFISGIGTVRSAAQLTGMGILANAESTRWLERAALIDPGSYRLRLQLARRGSGLDRDDRCAHAVAARSLQPNSRVARNLADGC